MAGRGGDADGGGHGANTSDAVPWLFGEGALREQLSNMYAAMVSTTGNAKLLLGRDPDDVRREDAEGGDTARDQMAKACGWLAEARITCETPQAFDDVFLGCARSAARYLVRVRDAGASTEHFDSWVFKKSSPPDAGAGPGRTVISAVVPALKTCMSVRAPPGVAEGIPLGFCRIGPATPMPLTNRLHCVTGAEVVPLPGRAPRLGGWDFLKASPSDLGALAGSLEMDAFCEVASVQDDSWQRLGAPVVLPGTVEDLDDSKVTLKGIGGEAVSALRQSGSPPPPDGLPHGSDALQAAGMHGRFLAVAWYQPRMRASASGSRRTKYAELLHFEECGRDEAVLDDLIGHVRMRGRTGAGGLAVRYGKDYASIVRRAACLTMDGEGAVAYGHEGGDGDGAGDGLVRAFLDAVSAMRAAWSQYRTGEGLPVAARDIASGERTDIASLASWMGRGGSDRKNLLADIQHEFDLEGYWRGERDGGAGSRLLDVPHIAAGLERQGLLSRNEGVLSVTDRGRKVLGAALKADAERYVSERDVLYLPESESRIPASVLMRYLRDGREFARAEGPDGRNALLWVREGADAAEGVKKYGAVLADQHRLVLECARTANHPINARFVRSELVRRGVRIACAHVSVMLGQLVRAGRLEEEGDGEWTYPMRGRIIDTMLAEPARAWDVDGIIGATGIAGRDAKDVGLALAALASDGLIAGLEDGRWGCRKDGMDEQRQRRRRAAALAGGIVLSALRSKGAGMDSGRLVEIASGRLSKMFSRNQVRGLKGIVRDAVSSLVENGRVEEQGGMLRLAA